MLALLHLVTGTEYSALKMTNLGLLVSVLCLFVLVTAGEEPKESVQEVIRSDQSSSCGDVAQLLMTHLQTMDKKLDLCVKDIQKCTNGHTFSCTYGMHV